MIGFETHDSFPKIQNLSWMKNAVKPENDFFLSVKVRSPYKKASWKLPWNFHTPPYQQGRTAEARIYKEFNMYYSGTDILWVNPFQSYQFLS